MSTDSAVAAPAVDLTGVPIEKLVKKFVSFRDSISERTKVYEAEVNDLKSAQELIENELLRRAQDEGVEGFTTQFGTTYKSIDMQVSIADDKAFYSAPNAIEMMQRRVSSSAVKKYMEDHEGKVPPGLNVFNQVRMKIRRKSTNAGE